MQGARRRRRRRRLAQRDVGVEGIESSRTRLDESCAVARRVRRSKVAARCERAADPSGKSCATTCSITPNTPAFVTRAPSRARVGFAGAKTSTDADVRRVRPRAVDGSRRLLSHLGLPLAAVVRHRGRDAQTTETACSYGTTFASTRIRTRHDAVEALCRRVFANVAIRRDIGRTEDWWR